MPIRSSCSRIAGTAAAACGVFTVIRTFSEPASASALTWIAVAIASAVSVLVIDCTTTGAPPPTTTTRSRHRTSTRRVRRRAIDPTGAGSQTVVRGSRVTSIGRPLRES